MKERIEIIDYKYKIALATFFIFIFITTIAPLSGADLASYNIGKLGIDSILKNLNIHSGNIIGSIVAPFLAYNKIIFNILFSLLMGTFVYRCNNLMGIVNNKHYYLFPLLGILLVSTFMFSYNYVSIYGAVNYTIPALLVFLYFTKIVDRETYKFSIQEYIELAFITLYISFSNIQISICFFVGNLIFFIVGILKKKLSRKFIIIMLLQILSVFTSICLYNGELFYTDVNIILSNIQTYIDSVFSNNILLFVLGLVPINYYLNDKLKDLTYKRVLIILFNVILIFSLIYNFSYYIPVNLNLIINKYSGVFATENWYYIFYYILYIILLIKSIIYFFKNKKYRNISLLILFVGLLLSLCSLASPSYNVGNNVLLIFALISAICVMIKEKEIRIFKKTTFIVLFMLVLYYGSTMSISRYIDLTRKDYINEQLEAKSEIIEVKANPLYLIYRYNPVTVFQQPDFKKYYDIPENNIINVKYFGIFEKIEKKVKE